ncbi:hypothetical protein [Neomicrococcus aestuarii]|uniref:N-acetyltransferase domain-containing protein n=1 Tax=Neomicrococcus aestuarii TaxID=556325 RepID=A0A1L2ZP52_9MICC|nr:hypothetical protein [Neomicrococcus aestuarii]APF41144.1 hypothetical protein BHE16_09215 [Neomicrococcus aestuarii]
MSQVDEQSSAHDNGHSDGHADEVDLLAWPAALGEAWSLTETAPAERFVQAFNVTENGEDRGTVNVASAARHPVGDSYPSGTRDRYLEPSEHAVAGAIQLVSEHIMKSDPHCRRLVLATDEGDVEQIARGEAAGYRYVVDVDLKDRSVSLLAAEPAWVLEESRNIDDVPGT